MRGTPIGMHHRCGSSVSCCARDLHQLHRRRQQRQLLAFRESLRDVVRPDRRPTHRPSRLTVPSGSRGAGLVADRRPLHFLAERANGARATARPLLRVQREIQP